MSGKMIDKNQIPGLIKQLNSLKSREVQLGIVAPSGDKMYMVAKVHEYGINIPVTDKMRGWFLAQGMPLQKETKVINIPERGFFRTGFDSNEGEILRTATNAINKVLQGDMTAYEARREVGEFASEKIRNNVSNVGLVKTGELRDSIGFRVVKA